MMEIIGYGILLAIGFYFAPFIVGGVVVVGSMLMIGLCKILGGCRDV